MQSELAELRKLAAATTKGDSTDPLAKPAPHPAPSPRPPTISAESSTPTAPGGPPCTSSSTTNSSLEGLCIADKYLGDVQLTASHVNELFRIYFTRCHRYLPFRICKSIEAIYERCPLLFWVICAVASADTARAQFEAPVRSLIADVLDPHKSSTVEMVQALLILCMWPFPFANQKTDSSFIYSGLATQISLSIGLHRPAIDAGFDNETTEHHGDEEIRRTTWLACFIVAQIQASRRGVPATVVADYPLLYSLDNPAVPQELSHLCYISHLTVDATHALGARGSNSAGLVEPSARISLINVFGKQFDDVRRQRFPRPSDVVEIFFLSSRLQIWSFALHNDVPMTANSVQIICQAREDAMRLIQIACEMNLSLVPFYTRRSVCYAALLLCRIKLGPYGWEDDMIDLHVERAQEALGVSEGPKLSQFIAFVTSPDNKEAFVQVSADKSSPHRSRLGAFLVFDFHQVYMDIQQSSVLFSSDFWDFDNLPWTEFP
ncbi:Regulatory protein leu3 [Rhinocladiella similis]